MKYIFDHGTESSIEQAECHPIQGGIMRAGLSMTEVLQVAGTTGNSLHEREGGWINGHLKPGGKNIAIEVAWKCRRGMISV
jgi:hypothetical protein